MSQPHVLLSNFQLGSFHTTQHRRSRFELEKISANQPFHSRANHYKSLQATLLLIPESAFVNDSQFNFKRNEEKYRSWLIVRNILHGLLFLVYWSVKITRYTHQIFKSGAVLFPTGPSDSISENRSLNALLMIFDKFVKLVLCHRLLEISSKMMKPLRLLRRIMI